MPIIASRYLWPASQYLVFVVLWQSAAAYDDRLWLPKAYESHYLKLVRAAEQAKALDRCSTILDATIDLAQSTSERPMYRVLCRQPNGRSYTEMVDGVNFDTLTTPKPVPETAEQKAQRLAQEEAVRQAALKKRVDQSWQLCYATALDGTQNMLSLTWLHEELPKPTELTDEQMVFEIDFDASSISGEKLRYRAHCTVYKTHELDLRVGPRPSIK